jgi:hypothetical protein
MAWDMVLLMLLRRAVACMYHKWSRDFYKQIWPFNVLDSLVRYVF